MIYGRSLTLEFVALICLRIREPELQRPFRVPGGLFGAIAVGIPPMLLLGFAIVRSEHEAVLGMSSFAFGMILIGGRGRLLDQPRAEAGGLDSCGREGSTGSLERKDWPQIFAEERRSLKVCEICGVCGLFFARRQLGHRRPALRAL